MCRELRGRWRDADRLGPVPAKPTSAASAPQGLSPSGRRQTRRTAQIRVPIAIKNERDMKPPSSPDSNGPCRNKANTSGRLRPLPCKSPQAAIYFPPRVSLSLCLSIPAHRMPRMTDRDEQHLRLAIRLAMNGRGRRRAESDGGLRHRQRRSHHRRGLSCRVWWPACRAECPGELR